MLGRAVCLAKPCPYKDNIAVADVLSVLANGRGGNCGVYCALTTEVDERRRSNDAVECKLGQIGARCEVVARSFDVCSDMAAELHFREDVSGVGWEAILREKLVDAAVLYLEAVVLLRGDQIMGKFNDTKLTKQFNRIR
jgi:hypothetical protein